MDEFARVLDVNTSRHFTELKQKVTNLGLSISHFNFMKQKVTDEALEACVRENTSFYQVRLKLGHKSHGTKSSIKLKQRIIELRLSTAHFIHQMKPRIILNV